MAKSYFENETGRRYVKADVIADYYAISPPTIYTWAKIGKIPCIRFEGTVRFNFEEVKAAIEGVPTSHPSEEPPPELEEQIEAAMAEGEEVVR
jgi:excisionase family DNA binding protein